MKKAKTLIFISILFIMISCNDSTTVKPDKSGFLQLDNAKIYYESFGKGEAVVLIHAGVTDSRMWNFQIEDLSKQFQVIRYDMRGYGKSSVPESAFNPNLDLLALLDSFNIDKANLVGISLGAFQAVDFLTNYPDRVKSLIISGPGFPDWPMSKVILDKHIEFSKYVAEKGADSAINKMLTDPFWSKSIPAKNYPKGRELFIKVLNENKNSFTVNWQFRKFTFNLKDKLSEIKCPTLMFRPENEMPSVIPICDTIKDKIENLKILEVKDASHLLNMEKPEEFNKGIIDFLKKS